MPVQMVIKPVPAFAEWFAAGSAPVLVAVLANVNARHVVFVAFHGLRDYMVSRSAALEAVVPFDTRDPFPRMVGRIVLRGSEVPFPRMSVRIVLLTDLLNRVRS